MVNEKKKYLEDYAKQFINELALDGRVFLYQEGLDYLYDGTRYVLVSDMEMELRVWLLKSGIGQSDSLVRNLTGIVRAMGRRKVSLPAWDGQEGGDTKPSDIVAYKNGLLNLATGEMREHTSRWLSTLCLPYDFSPAATCPHWLEFLDQVYESSPEKIGLLQEWAGYLLSGDTRQQKILLLVGLKRAGKSTILEILEGLVGVENSCATSFKRIATQFGLQGFLGKTACFIGEGDKGADGATEMLKDISGCGLQSVDRKRKTCVDCRLGVRFSIACNGVPAVWDTSGAIAGRLLVLDHTRTFFGKEDVGLIDRLKSELPGIANWARIGLERIRTNGRFTPIAKTGVAARVDLESASMLCFVKSRCAVESWCDSGEPGLAIFKDRCEIPKQVFFEQYRAWCNEHDLKDKDDVWIGRELRQVLPKITGGRQGGVSTYRGICLRAV